MKFYSWWAKNVGGYVTVNCKYLKENSALCCDFLKKRGIATKSCSMLLQQRPAVCFYIILFPRSNLKTTFMFSVHSSFSCFGMSDIFSWKKEE